MDTEFTSDDICVGHVKFHQSNEIDSLYVRANILPSLSFCAILVNQRIFDGFIVTLHEQLCATAANATVKTMLKQNS